MARAGQTMSELPPAHDWRPFAEAASLALAADPPRLDEAVRGCSLTLRAARRGGHTDSAVHFLENAFLLRAREHLADTSRAGAFQAVAVLKAGADYFDSVRLTEAHVEALAYLAAFVQFWLWDDWDYAARLLERARQVSESPGVAADLKAAVAALLEALGHLRAAHGEAADRGGRRGPHLAGANRALDAVSPAARGRVILAQAVRLFEGSLNVLEGWLAALAPAELTKYRRLFLTDFTLRERDASEDLLAITVDRAFAGSDKRTQVEFPRQVFDQVMTDEEAVQRLAEAVFGPGAGDDLVTALAPRTVSRGARAMVAVESTYHHSLLDSLPPGVIEGFEPALVMDYPAILGSPPGPPSFEHVELPRLVPRLLEPDHLASSAGSILRNYPVPLAVIFSRFHRSGTALERCTCALFLMVETVAKYLLAIAVADLLATRPGQAAGAPPLPEEVGRVLRSSEPATGHWLGALREALAAVAATPEGRPLLVRTLAERFGSGGAGDYVLARLGQLRNQHAHKELAHDEAAAERLLDKELLGLVGMLYAELSFLQRYPLCLLERAARPGNRVTVYRFMGLQPVAVEASLPADACCPDEASPFVLTGEDGAALPLSPFWRTGRRAVSSPFPRLLVYGHARAGQWCYAESFPQSTAEGVYKFPASTPDGPACRLGGAELLQELLCPTLPDLRGKRLQGYVVEDVLAEGGSACVFRARPADGPTDRRVAVKVLVDKEEPQWARFQREIDFLKSCLEDRGVIDCLADGEERAWGFYWPYYLMPCCPEGTLGDFIAAGGRDDPGYVRKSLAYFRQGLEAVAAVHARTILHRDLKPANFLLTADGRVVLCDFGHAVRLGSEETADSEPFPYGTYAYLPPERFFPKGRRDYLRRPQFDVYSLGVMLLHLFTGEVPRVWLPHEGEGVKTLPGSTVLRTAGIARLGEGHAGLVRVAGRCTQRDPAKRYATVGELLADFAATAAGVA